MGSLTFVIPTYNDEGTIETVIKRAVIVGKRLRIPFTLLVVNDASRDSTGHILEKLKRRYKNLRVITHTNNAGYGGTIKELYQKARTTWLFSVPGDYQIDPEEIIKLWPYRKNADMIIGWREVRHDSTGRLFQSGVYNRLLHLLFGLSVHDVNSVRLMKTAIMKSIHLTTSSAFVDAELVIRSQRAGFRIMEVPISHRARPGASVGGGGKPAIILPTIRDMRGFRI